VTGSEILVAYIPGILTLSPYDLEMKATLTSKGQITIPLKIRQRLGLKPGHQLEFDETAPFLKAVKVVDQRAWEKVRGMGQKRQPAASTKDWLEQTRGSVELPPARRKR
jgi:AbrB family looped-hinge helix DNA binding protein